MDFLRHLFAYISLLCFVICWNLTYMVTNNKRWQIRLPLLEFSTLTEDLKSILDEQFSSSVTRWRESSIGEQSCFGEKSKAEQPPKTAVNHETWNPSNYAPPEPQLASTKFQTKPRRDNKCCKTLSLPSLLAKGGLVMFGDGVGQWHSQCHQSGS